MDKKTLIGVILVYILMLVVVSCTTLNRDTKPRSLQPSHVLTPVIFEFDGHEYLWFEYLTDHGGIVHSPNCKYCNQSDSVYEK